MATTVLYRVSSGEVLKISARGQTFADRDATIWGVLTDPAFPDGTAVREPLPNGQLGPFRQLGFAKLAVGAVVRNATAGEIATFAGLEAADEAAQDVLEAAAELQVHPRKRKVFKALVKRIVAENNIQAQWVNDFRVQVAASANLADFKTRVATLGDLPLRTTAGALTALLNDLSPTD